MSESRSSSKRKRGEEENDDESSDDEVTETVFRGWLDEGVPNADGSVDYDSFSISFGENIIDINLGDSVFLRGISKGEESSDYANDPVDYYGSSPSLSGNKMMVARVERIWEERKSRRSQTPSDSTYKFRARWFLLRDDVESIRGEFSGPISTENFVSSLSNHDLILSNQTDDNPITSICGEAQVFYRRPESDGHSSSVPDGIYLCRYSIAFGANTSEGKVEVTPFTGDNDEWSDILAATLEPQAVQKTEERQRPSSKKSASSLGSTEDFRSTSTCSTEDSDSIALAIRTGGLDEGTTEQRDIRVGREHQAIVPAFVPNQEVVSRNPTLVWTPNKISQEEMDQFLEQAAQILTPYLRDNKLTHEEPYSPLPPDDMEEMVRARVGEVLPTLCSICTASSLSKKSNNMLRECDGDSILALLHEKGYDVQAALAAIEASPLNFLTAWSLQEKELFNSGFRRFSGSLRTICKGITPSKDFHDVIDYHYRFKIPDQFRRFQEKKREMAVRMLECIETRRNIHTVIQVDYERSVTAEAVAKKRSKESEWFKTGMADITGAVEERRVKAKELLLDVESQFGKEKMAEVADSIKHLHQKSITELKTNLVDIFKGDAEFQKRFLEFLPKRFRS